MNASDIRSYNRLFKLKKEQVNRALKTGEISDGPLNAGIKDLIYAMNRLSFLFTTQSGAGGVHSSQIWDLYRPSPDGIGGEYAYLPSQTPVMFWQGDISIVLAHRQHAKKFKNDLETLVVSSPGASIKEDLPLPLFEGKEPGLQWLSFTVNFSEKAPIRKMAPMKAPVLPYSEAIMRDRYRRTFMSGLWALTMKYLPTGPNESIVRQLS